MLADGSRLRAPYVLANCAPATLRRLLGEAAEEPEGSQTKINIVVRRLPRFRSGVDPEVGFAGTLHLGQGYRRLQEAYEEASAGAIPDPMPCEIYCHTLTDPTILDAELRRSGYHTLTLFGLHTPARLFADDPAGSRQRAKLAALRTFQQVLAEPLEDCLALDASGPAVHRGDDAARHRGGGRHARGSHLPRRSRLAMAGRRRGSRDAGRTLGSCDPASRDPSLRLRSRTRRCRQRPRRAQRSPSRPRILTIARASPPSVSGAHSVSPAATLC